MYVIKKLDEWTKLTEEQTIYFIKGYLTQIKETREIYLKELKKEEWNRNGFKYKFLLKLLKNLEDQEKNIKKVLLNEETN